MYIDKLIKREVITLLVSVSLLVILFIGVTYAKFLSVDKGQDTVINMGDLNISFCKETTCDSTYTNIGQVIGTKIENGASVPASIYPFKDEGLYSNETPYIFKIENTGSLDSTVKIKLKEDASFTPSGDYSDYARLTSKYASHLKVAIKKRILYKDTGYQLGDANMDGIVNNIDSNLIQEYFLKGETIQKTFNKEVSDINEDGEITTADSGKLQGMILGKLNDIYSSKVYTYTDLEDGVIFKDDIIKSGESAIYFLWLYLDNTTPNDAQKTYFVGNIDVDGEYSLVPEPDNFATDSWATIINAIEKNNISKYNVGDTKEIDMGTYGTHTLRIANTSTPNECSTTGFSQSACGFVLEFADIITTHAMNDTDTNVGGWPATSMRTFVNNNIYNSIPSELKNAIIETTVVSGYGPEGTTNFTSMDKLYLLSTTEILEAETDDTAKSATRTLDYYIDSETSMPTSELAIKGKEWWIRSPSYSGVHGVKYYYIDTFGGLNDGYSATDDIHGVSPAFRIG